MNAVSWARTLAFFSLAVAAAVTQTGKARGAGDPLVDHVRAATERFKDVAAATAEGYVANGCATSLDGGAMGVRYVNATYLKDAQVDITRPQAVLYEPLPDGKLTLVGVQYMTFKGPASLDGETFGFVGIAGNRNVDRHLDFRMQRDRDLVPPDHLDRRVESDLAARQCKALVARKRRDVTWRYRAVQLATFRRLTQHREALAVELVSNLLRIAPGLEIARFELDLHRLKARAVLLRGAQRLAARQQKVTGKAVLDAHDLTHLAEIGDTFEQDHFHCQSPFN